MFFATTLVSAFALFAAVRAAPDTVESDFSVGTPKTAASCMPVTVSWEKTSGPYNLIIVKSSDPCGPIIKDLGDVNVTKYTFNADFPAGSYSVSIEDGKGQEGWSKAFKITNSTDSSCKYAVAPTSNTTVVGNPSDSSSPVANAGGATPSDDVGEPVGAAGSGPLSVGAALSSRQLSTSALALSVLAALAFTL